jgi:hypothetical protein
LDFTKTCCERSRPRLSIIRHVPSGAVSYFQPNSSSAFFSTGSKFGFVETGAAADIAVFASSEAVFAGAAGAAGAATAAAFGAGAADFGAGLAAAGAGASAAKPQMAISRLVASKVTEMTAHRGKAFMYEPPYSQSLPKKKLIQESQTFFQSLYHLDFARRDVLHFHGAGQGDIFTSIAP